MSPSEIEKWLEEREKESDNLYEKNRKDIFNKAQSIHSHEEEISRWIDTIEQDETEEIFRFLTEERNKFLSKTNQEILTSHTDSESSHNNTLSSS